MYWIKRCYFDGVGHPESFYRHQVIDFFPKSWEVKSNHVPHTYIDLVNGGGKTTWISLLLTLFEPQKNRFIQCVAGRKKGKKYHYNDYFHRQLSTIMVEMVDDQQRSVILGQYNQKHGDQTDVEHFICEQQTVDFQGFSLFDEIPSVGRSQNNPQMKVHTESIKSIRGWLREQHANHSGYWRYYGKRNAWHDALGEIGVNLQMIDTLITINSEEGGVSHFARYRSESDFLQKFFACCFPAREIDSLMETCAKDVEQGGELRALREKDAFYQDLNTRWVQFKPLAQEVTEHFDNLKHAELDLSELLRDLRAFSQYLEQKVSDHKQRIRELDTNVEANQNELKRKKSRLGEATYQISLYEYEVAETVAKRSQSALEGYENELLILQAASDYKAYKHQDSQFSQQRAVLEALRSEKEGPLVHALEQAQGQARFVFDREINVLSKRKKDVGDNIDSLTEDCSQKEIALQKTSETIIRSQTGLEQCEREIAAADTELEELKLKQLIHVGESPEVAHKRLTEANEQAARDLHVAQECCDDSNTRRSAAEEKRKHAEQQLNDADIVLSCHQERVNQAKYNQEQIQVELRSVGILLDIEDAQFITEYLSQSMVRKKQEVDAESEENHRISHQLNELRGSEHLLVDTVTHKALNLFYEQGLSQEQISPYPEYLSRVLEDDAQRIAAIIDANPGRYLGLAVSDSDTMQKVELALGSIPWSDRPIPISEISEADLTPNAEVVDAVLVADDKVLYSKKECEQRIFSLKQKLKNSDERLNVLSNNLRELQSVQTKWCGYWENTGSKWLELLQALGTAQHEKVSAAGAKKQAEQALTLVNEQCTKASQQLTDSSLSKKNVDIQCQEVYRFLMGAWNDKAEAELKRNQLLEKVEEYQKEQGDLQQGIKSTRQQLSQFDQKQGELNENFKALLSSFNNSSFNNADPIEIGSTGMSTDAASKAIALAEEALKQFRHSPEITQAERSLEEIKEKREKSYDHLSAKQGWQNFQEQVIDAAQVEGREIEQELANKTQAVAGVKEQLRSDTAHRNQMYGSLQAAKNTRPRGVVLSGGIVGLKQQRTDFRASIELLDRQLGNDCKEQEFYTKESFRKQEEKSRCENLVNEIMGRTLESADGTPKKISDVSQVQSQVKTAKQQFDNYKVFHKKAENQAEVAWHSFIETINVEAAKSYDSQRDTTMVLRLKGMSYKDSLERLENTTIGLQECLDANRDLIEKIQRSWDSTVILMGTHLRKAIQMLQDSTKVKIPGSSPIHPGKNVFKMSDRLSRLPSDEFASICRMSLEQWIKDGQIPGSDGTRNKLTAFLVQKLFPEGELDIKLIKTSRTTRANYFPIHEPTGSDGQLLTTAFLLYMVIAKVRAAGIGDEAYGFMVADNPIGECNADDLVKMQLKMASAIGVQLIYLTGHDDFNAQAMFDKNIFMGRVKRLNDLKLVGIVKEDEDKESLWNAGLDTPSLLRHEDATSSATEA